MSDEDVGLEFDNDLLVYANKVADSLVNNQKVSNEVAFDPAIIAVILEVLKFLADNCNLFNKPNSVVDAAQKPNAFQRFALKQHVRRVIDDKVVFKLYGQQIVEALLDAGSKSTPEEVSELVRLCKYC